MVSICCASHREGGGGWVVRKCCNYPDVASKGGGNAFFNWDYFERSEGGSFLYIITALLISGCLRQLSEGLRPTE